MGHRNFRSYSAMGDVVDGGLAAAHKAVFGELPLLVAVGAEPLAGCVVEPFGDSRLPYALAANSLIPMECVIFNTLPRPGSSVPLTVLESSSGSMPVSLATFAIYLPGRGR